MKGHLILSGGEYGRKCLSWSWKKDRILQGNCQKGISVVQRHESKWHEYRMKKEEAELLLERRLPLSLNSTWVLFGWEFESIGRTNLHPYPVVSESALIFNNIGDRQSLFVFLHYISDLYILRIFLLSCLLFFPSVFWKYLFVRNIDYFETIFSLNVIFFYRNFSFYVFPMFYFSTTLKEFSLT